MVRTLDHETKQLASKVSNSKHSAQVDRVSQNNLPFVYGGEGGGLVELRLPLAIVCNWLELGKQTRGGPQEVRCKKIG